MEWRRAALHLPQRVQKQILSTAGTRMWIRHGRLPWVDYAQKEENEENDEDNMKYKEFKDVPDWYMPTVEKPVKVGVPTGTGGGLNVSEDYCRVMTTLDWLGKLD